MKLSISKRGIGLDEGVKIYWISIAGFLIALAAGAYFSWNLNIKADELAANTEHVEPISVDSGEMAQDDATAGQPTSSTINKRKTTGNSSSSSDSGGTASSTTSGLYVVYGDTRTNHDVHQAIVNLIAARNPVVVLHTGDLVEDGNNADLWTIFNNIVASIKNRLYPVLGNHENNSPLYYSNFSLPGNEEWYTLSSNYFNIIALDSNVAISSGSEQYNWLVSTLQATDRNKPTIVYFHHPPYGTAKAEVDPKGLRSSIVPLFEQYGVDLVLNGDHHDYERSLVNGVYYIVSGGGGAPLNTQVISSPYSQLFLSTYEYATFYSQDGTIYFKAYDTNNAQIDSVTITNR